MTRTATLVAAAVIASTAAPQAVLADGIDDVGTEFLAVMTGAGWKDARFASIRGTEDLFEIAGFVASSPEGSRISVGKMTVKGLVPDDRWTRADSFRVDDLSLVRRGAEVRVGMIFADKAGVLDIDTPRRSLRFDTLVAKDASVSFSGRPLLSMPEIYASGARWIDTYGIPGSLAVNAKVSASPDLVSLATGSASARPVEGRLDVVSRIDTMRSEARVSMKLDAGTGGSAALGLVFTEVGDPLFRAWYDLYDLPERKRSEEVQKGFAEAFMKKIGEIGLKGADAEFVGGADAWTAQSAAVRLFSLAPWLRQERNAAAAASALAGFAGGSGRLVSTAYSRLAPPVTRLFAGDDPAAAESFGVGFKK